MTVTITPMPSWARKTRFRPLPPPVFDGEPTQAEVQLARALFEALDAESQVWYGGEAFAERLRARLPK